MFCGMGKKGSGPVWRVAEPSLASSSAVWFPGIPLWPGFDRVVCSEPVQLVHWV